MNSISTKTRSMIATALCLCLLFSGAANAYVMYVNDMGIHGGVVEGSAKTAIQHHKHSGAQDVQLSDSSSSHDCCDTEEQCVSSGATCATHCSASATDVNQCLFQFKRPANFTAAFEQADPTFVNLAGPFKPPRQ